jgi:ATP-dependent Clp protease adaptor protein ClpS
MSVVHEIEILKQYSNEVLVKTNYPYSLIVWNDEVNTFEWVIESLINVCKHSEEQAEQCAMIIHFQGKYAVKNGELENLKLMKDAIIERGINATIEKVVNA